MLRMFWKISLFIHLFLIASLNVPLILHTLNYIIPNNSYLAKLDCVVKFILSFLLGVVSEFLAA